MSRLFTDRIPIYNSMLYYCKNDSVHQVDSLVELHVYKVVILPVDFPMNK